MASKREPLPNKIAIDMTPMIDVVFQLITFFMLTLKSVVAEGDFDIRMPLGTSAGAAPDDPIPPVRVRMTAGPGGERTSLTMNGQPVGDFEELRRFKEPCRLIESSTQDRWQALRVQVAQFDRINYRNANPIRTS